MTLSEFKASLHESSPPNVNDVLLKALWYDGKNDWNMAHTIVQDVNSAEGSWVHAYLHRKEGDEGNASYWYHRAKRTVSALPLEQEWDYIVSTLLEN